MKDRTRETAFSMFALGLIGLCFLLLFYESVVSRQLWREIPRIVAGLLSPLPLALFLAFCFRGGRQAVARHEVSPAVMSLFLAGSIGLVLVAGFLFSGSSSATALSGIGPVIAQSALLTTSVLNLLFLKHGPTAAACSGGSIGLTVHVIFFS
jgi:hypothetical protein